MTGFNPYPQARNLMRRMLGLKPIAVKPRRRQPPPLGVPVETARFVPQPAEPGPSGLRLLLRGLLGGLERVQHLLLHVGRRPRRAAARACRSTACATRAVMARLGRRGQRERAVTVGADEDGDVLRRRCDRSFHARRVPTSADGFADALPQLRRAGALDDVDAADRHALALERDHAPALGARRIDVLVEVRELGARLGQRAPPSRPRRSACPSSGTASAAPRRS